MREQTVFIEALEKEGPAERAAFLDQACAGDPDLRERIERLLQRHQETAGFLDSAQSPLATRGDEPIKEGPGTVIGQYKLLEQIGEGGFGVVFMAEQMQPVRRKVALKVLKPGMDTRQVVARFEAERQALALMDHPNIAHVFDGGETVSGRPYFVMELVRGIPITDFCDQSRLTLSDRLELFVHVCQAVQHAHHKGIIHRDLKPSNVLVTLHDGTPVAKVIDFGIAKAAGQQLTDKTLFTNFAQWIGTPLYMSPEQAALSGLDVDTRSDIYSLGVLLYELLTGTTPFDKERFRTAAYDEIRRIIREEEPPTPSTRLSDSKDTLASISAQRHTEPAKLTKLVRGELDWIVMKALEKDRNRRYETANGLAMDLKRYLADEPVEARPSSASYRLRKFLKRNKGPVLAASIVLLALVGGIIGTTVGMIHADNRRIEADQARAAEAEQRTKAEKARDRTRQALDAMTSSFTEDSLSTQQAISDEQKRFLSEVLSYYQEFAGEKAGDEQSRARTAQAAERVGTIESRLGRKTEAESAFLLARDGYEKLVADFPAVLRYRQEPGPQPLQPGDCADRLGQGAGGGATGSSSPGHPGKAGRRLPRRARIPPGTGQQPQPAGAFCRSAWAKARRRKSHIAKLWPSARSWPPTSPPCPNTATDWPTATTTWGFCWPAWASGRRRSRIIARPWPSGKGWPRSSPPCPRTARSWLAATPTWQYWWTAWAGGRRRRSCFAKPWPSGRNWPPTSPPNPNAAGIWPTATTTWGFCWPTRARRPEAEQHYRQAVAIREKLAADFPAVPKYRQELASSHNNLGHLLAGLGKGPEAEQSHRQAVAIGESLAADFPAVPQYRQELAKSHNGLGLLLADLGKGPEAEQTHRQALAIGERLAASSPPCPNTATNWPRATTIWRLC